MAQNLNGSNVTPAKNIVKINVLRTNVKQTKVVDTDIVFVLEDGRTVFIRDGAVQSLLDNGFSVEFSDGTQATGQELLQSAGSAEISSVALTGPQASSNDAVIVAQAPQAAGTSPVAQPSSGGGLRTWLAVGTPLVGGVLGGVLGGGSSTATATTDPSTTANVKPTTPVINVIANDDKVNATEKAGGVSVTGMSEASASVTVNWGSTTKTVTADSTGRWSASFASTEVPADAAGTTISATVKSTAGVSSEMVTKTVQIDTTPPAAPVIASIAGDDAVGPSEAAAGVTVRGISEPGSRVSIVFGTTTKVVLSDSVGNFAAQFVASELPLPGSYTISATAIDAFGNVSISGARATAILPAVNVEGVIVAGPLVAGHGLTVDLLRSDGGVLIAGVPVDANGRFSVIGLQINPGDVVIARTNDASDGADFLDEATGNPTDLSARLLAVQMVSGSTVTMNISPLTTIAAQKAGLGADGSGTVANASAVTNANQAVASAFGLNGIDIVTTPVVPTNGGQYNPDDGLSSGEAIGAVLAALSGVDGINGGNMQTTINTTAQSLTVTGTSGALAEAAQIRVMEGAARADANTGGNLQQVISDRLSNAAQITQVTIDTVGGDNVVVGAEVTGLTISGTVSAGATAVVLTLGTATANATISGTTWSYTLTQSDVTALGADGAKVITATANFGATGSQVATRPIIIDIVPPAVPVINAISTDNVIGVAERAAGISVSGTAEPDSLITLTIGSATRTTRSSSTGEWTIPVATAEIPNGGTAAISVTATDPLGNTSAPATRNLVVDVTPPAAPTINVVSGDDLVGPVDVSGGLAISGTGEAGAQVRITLGSAVRTATVGANGAWTTTFSSSQIPADGDYDVAAIQIDAAGNTGTQATRTIRVDVAPPLPPSISLVTADGIVNATEKAAGVTIRGTSEANVDVEIQWGNVTRTVRASSTGTWSATFTGAQVPADGNTTISATAIDRSGNTSETRTRSVVVDTAAVVPTINFVATDDVINSAEKDAGVTFTGTAEASASVAVTVGATTRTVFADSTGAWSALFNGTELPADGNASITAVATDLAGNVSTTATRPFTVSTSTSLKTPTIDAVSQDDIVSASERVGGVTITGTADSGTIVTIRWGTSARTANVDDAGNWTTTFPSAEVPFNGQAIVSVTSADTLGNSSSPGTRTVLIDTIAPVAPSIALVATDDRVSAAEKSAGVTVSGSAEAGSRVAVTWGATTLTATAGTTGAWSVQFTSAQIPDDGNTTITAAATDIAGNAGPAATRPVAIDTGAPAQPIIATIAADDRVSALEKAASVTVSGTAEANSTVSVVWGSSTKSAVAGSNGVWSANFLSDEIPSDGSTSVLATATDAFGNTSTPASRPIAIDTQAPPAPVINLVGALVGTVDTVNNNLKVGGVTVAGQAEANATVVVTWGTASKTVTASSTGAWSADFLESEVPADGLSTISAVATDATGNAGVASTRSVNIDTAAPALPEIDPVTADNVINLAERQAGVSITGTAEAGARVRVQWGSFSGEATANSLGVWEIAVPGSGIPEDGTFDVTATATDPAGNVSQDAARSVVINTGLPAAPVINAISGNDIVGSAEKDAGVTVFGTGLAGATVSVTWNGIVRSAIADTQGAWSVLFEEVAVPADANYTITAVQTDLDGNTGATGTRTVVVDTAAPVAPAINAVSTDDIVNAAEKTAGVSVSGSAEANASVTVAWGTASKTVTADGSGIWSTNFASSEIPADGTTSITATATDAAGNQGAEGTRSVVIDTSAPAAPSVNMVAGDDIISAAEKTAGVSVAGTAEANATVNVTWGTTTKPVTADSSGAWSVNFASSEIPEDGSMVVSVTATDAAGNVSAAGSRNVTVATGAPPAPTISAVSTDDLIGATEKANGIDVSGTSLPGASVAVSWNGFTRTVTANGSGAWTARFVSAEIPGDGTTAISAIQTDLAGNVGPAITRNVTVDTVAPGAPTIGDVSTDNTVNAAEKAAGVPVSGTAEANATVSVTWGSTTKQVTANGSGVWSVTFASSEIPADGTGSISAIQTDTAGNAGTLAGTRSVIVDTTAPAAPVIGAVATDNVVNTAEKTAGVAVSGTAEANAAVSVTWGTTTKPITADSSGVWSVTFAASEVPADGTTSISATQTDTAGNTGVAGTRSVVIDSAAPAAPEISVVGQDDRINALEKSSGVLVSGSAEPFSVVNVTLGLVTKTALADDLGFWGLSFLSSEIPSDGDVSISATATDEAGNVSIAGTRPITIDTVAPGAPTIGDVSTDNIVNAAEKAAGVPVSGTAEANATVSVTWGSTTKQATANGSGVWSVTFASSEIPADGTGSISAIQTDTAGNAGTLAGTRSVVVDTTAPAAPVIGAVATDNVVNSAEKTAGVAVSGTAEANAAVSVTWGTTTKPITANDSGVWSVTFAANEVPADGTTSISATQTDTAGNTGVAGTRSVVVDTASPAAPTIAVVAGDDIINTAEHTAGSVTVAGTTEANASVSVSWGGVTRTATANASGEWSTTFAAVPVSADGPSTISAVATDTAGNQGATGERVVTIDRTAPAAAVITAISNDDGVFGDFSTSASAFRVAGTAEAGATVQVFAGGVLQGSTVADAAGRWVSSDIAFANRALGSNISITVQQTDASGNTGALSSAQLVTRGTRFDARSLSPADGIILQGVTGTNNNALARTIAVGDINNDGRPDLAFSSPAVDRPPTNDTGMVYVAFGQTIASGGALDASGRATLQVANLTGTTGFRIWGDTTGEVIGERGLSMADVNGDGIDDLLISSNNANGGSIYVVYGKQNGTFGTINQGISTVDVRTLAPADGLIIRAEAAGDELGRSTSIGDVNGDGINDFIVGAMGNDSGASNGGAAYVVFGKAGGAFPTTIVNGRAEFSLSNLLAADGFKLQGTQAIVSPADGSGNVAQSIAGGLDFNGDGIKDFLVGAARTNFAGRTEAGTAYLIFGKAAGQSWGTPDANGKIIRNLEALTAAEGVVIRGDAASDLLGFRVAMADINNDGFAELLLTAPGGDDGGSNTGETYVIWGKQNGTWGTDNVIDVRNLAPTDGFIIQGDRSGNMLAVSSAGDFNGDGVEDLLIGAESAAFGGTTIGGAYVVYGKASGGFGSVNGTGRQVLTLNNLPEADGFVVRGDAQFDAFGRTVAKAGDLNNDGFDDLVIGAPLGDDNGFNNGEAYIIFGRSSTTGVSALGTVAGETIVGNNLNDTLVGRGGADVLVGLGGNDILAVSDTSFARIDGGVGTDTLRLDGSGLSLDLTAIAQGVITGMEQIDITGSGNNSLVVNQAALLALSDTSDQLTVRGNAGDTVTATGFTAGANQIADGIEYQVYTNGSAVLWVQQGVSVAGTLPPPSGFIDSAFSWADQAVLAV